MPLPRSTIYKQTHTNGTGLPYRSNDGALPLILIENAVALLFFLTHHSNTQSSLSSYVADSNINKQNYVSLICNRVVNKISHLGQM